MKRVTLLVVFTPAFLFAQEFRATISGMLYDPAGALIPGVRVAATEMRTGVSSKTVTDAKGEYALPFLPPGVYRVTAEAQGFKTFQQDGLTLLAGGHPTLDIRLEVGDISESVKVTADAPLLETSNGSTGQVITTQQVDDTPLNGRSPLMLAQLALGVTLSNAPNPVRPYDNANSAAFSIGGAANANNELLLDGTANSTWDHRSAYNPPQDSVQEVHVQAFDPDAAYGHSGGGTLNVITKSGTNAFHGSGYDFDKFSWLAAQPFFTNSSSAVNSPGGIQAPAATFNQGGISAGGPVYIPKVFDGRNRLFWFFTWERIAVSQPNVSEGGINITTVPTAAERNGDFSALLGLGSNYQIYDPSTGVPSGSQIQRQPFPNNIIPSSRINPIAQSYLKLYSAPNIPGLADGLNNFSGAGIVSKDSFNNELSRVDYNISDRHKLFGNFRHDYSSQDYNNIFSNGSEGYLTLRTNWGSSLDDVYTFNPSTVMNVRLNWTRFIENEPSYSDGANPSSLGFPSNIASSSEFLTLPYIEFGSCGSSTYQCVGAATNKFTPYDIFQIFSDVVKVTGTHTLKMGFDVREYRKSFYQPGCSVGCYVFGTGWTNGPFSNSAASPLGQDMAAFLLGVPTSGQYDLSAYSTIQSKYYALFLQDDWRVKSNLTLNLGIRWEYESPTSEKYNRAVDGFNTSVASPIASAAMAAYAGNPIPQIPAGQFAVPGGLTFAGANNRGIYAAESKIFSPRLGFAWSPRFLGGKTILRGGTGVFVYPVGVNGGLALNQEGFSQTTPFQATLNNYLTPANTLSNPFPTGIQQPPGSSLGLSTFLGQSITFFNSAVRNPYSVRWDFSIQHQLPGNILLEVGYIGNHSVHLPVASTALDYIPARFLSTSPTRDQATINLLGSSVANPFQGLIPGSSLNGSTVSLQQLTYAYPQFSSVTKQNNGAGTSYYQSLDIRLEKRFSNEFSLISAFVWNSLIQRLEYLNSFDSVPVKEMSPDSRPLRTVTGFTYQLPVGRGKPINLSNWKNQVPGGWVVSGIYTWQSGPPLVWGNVIYNGGDIHLNASQVNGPAFDTSSFNTISSQQLADNIRTFNLRFNNLRADPTNALDTSLVKEFHFTERTYLQVRFEAFNALNHPIFGPPNLTPTSTAFGLITTQANTPRQGQLSLRFVW